MRLLLFCLFSAALSFLGGAWMMTTANPEVTFWSDLRDRRDEELAIKRYTHSKPFLIFTGGSSCAFSIRSEMIEQATGRPTMNYGAAAGTGSKFLIEQALRRCKEGDMLVLNMEPHFLVEEGRGKPTQLGMALAAADKDLKLATGGDTFGAQIVPGEVVNYLRPGARYSATWAGKALRGDLSYRYKATDVRAGGWLETDYKVPPLVPAGALPRQSLCAEGRALLETTRYKAGKRGIRVFYALPWCLTSEVHAAANRENNRGLLKEIGEIVPVLEDPALGVETRRELFSDTANHLNAEGASHRSHTIAEALRTAVE